MNGACTCPGELVDCDGRCIDPRSDKVHCGTGTACEELVACGDEFLCVNGACTCPEGLVDCDGRCIDPRTDVAHCGTGATCAELTACDPGFVCLAGGCTCPEGQAACTGPCIDILGDPLNCNGCGVECPPGGDNTVPTCSAGVCGLACASGYGDCDGDPATGCETALAAGDGANCGGCGVTCGETEECLVAGCVDRAPYLASTTPAAGGTMLASGATITLTFSEPVDPTGDWFAFTCASGPRGPADFTVTENGSVWTLVPNVPFEAPDSCTVVVFGAQVADEDNVDPADTMAADYEFSFDLGNTLVLLSEDFEAGMPPGWTLFNVDGGTPAAQVGYVTDAWIVREDFKFNVDDHAAFSTSWYNPAGSADDWMITPAIALPAGWGCLLEWRAVTYDPGYRDGYEVRISTSDASPAGAMANPPLLDLAQEQSVWTPRSVDLSPYAGSTVYLAFRNDSDDMFLLVVDDIRVTCTP